MKRLILGVAVTAACGAPPANPQWSSVDSAGVRISSSPSPESAPRCRASPLPQRVVGSVDGSESNTFQRIIGAALLADGGVAVADQRGYHLKVFDADNKHVRTISRQGDGPGELRRLIGLQVSDSTLNAVEGQGGLRISQFTYEGSFIGAIVPEPRILNSAGAHLLPDGTVLALRECCGSMSEIGFQPTELQVLRLTADGEVQDTFARLPTRRMGVVGDPGLRLRGPPLFEPRARVALAADRVALAHSATAEIRLYDRSGRLNELVRWISAQRRVSNRHIEAERDERLAAAPDSWGREAAQALTSPAVTLNDFFPVFDNVVGGRDGTLWVSEYPLPGERGDDRQWLLFADGHLRCRVAMPERFDPMDVYANKVVGRLRDALDVEVAAIYDIEDPISDR